MDAFVALCPQLIFALFAPLIGSMVEIWRMGLGSASAILAQHRNAVACRVALTRIAIRYVTIVGLAVNDQFVDESVCCDQWQESNGGQSDRDGRLHVEDAAEEDSK